MAVWRSVAHLEDHYVRHHGLLSVHSVEAYDASADETIVLGTRFTYRDRDSREPRVGYFHRETSRFVAVDLDGVVRAHYITDEADMADLPLSTYQD
jgi:hypothetical protein